MKRNKEEKKKKKKRGCFGFVFGIFEALGILVLLLLVATVGLGIYLYRDMRDDPVTVRPLDEYRRAEVTCDPSRISFSEDGTMKQSYSSDEIMWLFTRMLSDEKIDIDEYVKMVPELNFRGVAVETDGDDVVACAEGEIRGIRLVVRCGIEIRPDWKENRLSLLPEWVSVGKLRIPINTVKRVIMMIRNFVTIDISEMELRFGYEPVALQRINSIRLENGRFVISGPMSTTLPDSHVIGQLRIRIMRFAQPGEELAGPVIDTAGDEPAFRYATLLPLITEEPEKYFEFLRQFFPVCSAQFTRDFFEKEYGIAKLWFPDPDPDMYETRRQELLEDYYVKVKSMRSICDKTSNGFYYGRYRINEDGAYYRGKEFDPYYFYGSEYNDFKSWLNVAKARFCTVRRSADERQAAGMLLRGADGWGYLIEFYSAVEYNIYPLDEGVFTDLLQAEKTPEIILDEYSISAPEDEGEGWI